MLWRFSLGGERLQQAKGQRRDAEYTEERRAEAGWRRRAWAQKDRTHKSNGGGTQVVEASLLRRVVVAKVADGKPGISENS